MLLATMDDYEYPHMDWRCRECGEAYRSAGYPPETRCTRGHGSGWAPETEIVEGYIAFLQFRKPGDGIVVCGDGPAPLMGRIESVHDNHIVTESLDAPGRVIRWDWDERTIEWRNADEPDSWWSDVQHVEGVEVIE